MRVVAGFMCFAILLITAGPIVGCNSDDGPTGPSNLNVYVVIPDGTGDFATIQEAIDAAAEGDTIALADGIYTGEGNREIQYRGKAVTVMSQNGNPEACIIDCEQSGYGFYFIRQEGRESVLMGVKVINGRSSSGAGVIISNVSSPTIINCIFSDNIGTEAGGGMHVHDNSSPEIRDCIFSNNSTPEGGGGIYISESSPTFMNCTIVENTAESGGGLIIAASSPTLVNCTIAGNTPDGINCLDSEPVLENTIIAFNYVGVGVVCADNCDITLDCCDIFGNADGDSTDCVVDQFGVRGNISEDPLFCPAGDYRLQSASPCAPGNSSCGLMGARPVGCD